MELNYHAHLRLHLCFIFLAPSLSVFVALYLHLFQSTTTSPLPLRPPSPPPPCCSVKTAGCEDMMEHLLSSLWISVCMDSLAHTYINTFASVRTPAKRPMHHIKVLWVSLTLMSLISVGYQWGEYPMLQENTAKTLPQIRKEGSGIVCHCVQDKELEAEFKVQQLLHYVYKQVALGYSGNLKGKSIVCVLWWAFLRSQSDTN